MYFDEIERLLGQENVAAMHSSLEKAFVQSRKHEGGAAALIDLLLTQIASIAGMDCSHARARERAEYCADRLFALVDAVASAGNDHPDVECYVQPDALDAWQPPARAS